MDTSREQDLRELHKIFNDPEKPLHVRRTAHRSFQNIQKQMEDRKLGALRVRLIGAVRANDHPIIEKLEEQIREYSFKRGYTKVTE